MPLTGAGAAPGRGADVVDLLVPSDVLARLREFAPRPYQVVLHEFFGGCAEGEIASLLDVTERALRRDGETARDWLWQELAADGEDFGGAIGGSGGAGGRARPTLRVGFPRGR